MILHDENHPEISACGVVGAVPPRPGELLPGGPSPPLLPRRGPRDRPRGAAPAGRRPSPRPLSPLPRAHAPRRVPPGRPARVGAPDHRLGDRRPAHLRGGNAGGGRPCPPCLRDRLLRRAARRMARDPLGIQGNAARPRPDRRGAHRRGRDGARVPRDHAGHADLPRPGLRGRAADGRGLPLLPPCGGRTAPGVRPGGPLRPGRQGRSGEPGPFRRDDPQRPAREAGVPAGLLPGDDVPLSPGDTRRPGRGRPEGDDPSRTVPENRGGGRGGKEGRVPVPLPQAALPGCVVPVLRTPRGPSRDCPADAGEVVRLRRHDGARPRLLRLHGGGRGDGKPGSGGDGLPVLGAQRARALPGFLDLLAFGPEPDDPARGNGTVPGAEMTVLSRYLLREFTRAAVACILGFLVLFLLIDFVASAEKLLRYKAELSEIGWYYASRLPGVFVMVSPVGTLLAVLVSV